VNRDDRPSGAIVAVAGVLAVCAVAVLVGAVFLITGVLVIR
jgi:hypothetical protein